ncbi:MAG TPA: efflux RND transporter periplasmic adaptor subunit, partial [Polyangiaceae bacterium]|nr:efflux RND transporter periplasmic adaptor subunit [Polyangiaceae bacterium]
LPLVKNGTVPEATGVQASQQRQLVSAQLDGARAQQALARAALTNHVLRAPFAGTITQAPTGIGAVVSPGQPLFGLVDTTKLKLATTVSEADANLLERGAEVHLAASAGDVSGRVTAILATLDVRTRRVPVVVEFDNARARASGPTLRAGAFVRGWVVARDPINVLRLPHNVQSPGSRDEVWVLGTGSRLESRQIGYAIAPNGDLLVHAGISAEDQLVLDPIPELKAGDAVRVAATGATAAPAAEAATTPSQVRTP